MSFAFSKGTISLDCNSTVNNTTVTITGISSSNITNSTIDMAGGIITGSGTPVFPTDVPNKAYVDGISTSAGYITTITLTGTAKTIIIPDLLGNISIEIYSLVSGGPGAVFAVSKNHSTRYPSLTRTGSSSGLVTEEKLNITWDPGTELKLSKTGLNYDGLYQCKLIINN